jgi:hypothetical protein
LLAFRAQNVGLLFETRLKDSLRLLPGLIKQRGGDITQRLLISFGQSNELKLSKGHLPGY